MLILQFDRLSLKLNISAAVHKKELQSDSRVRIGIHSMTSIHYGQVLHKSNEEGE
jgi:hypothetical protein